MPRVQQSARGQEHRPSRDDTLKKCERCGPPTYRSKLDERDGLLKQSAECGAGMRNYACMFWTAGRVFSGIGQIDIPWDRGQAQVGWVRASRQYGNGRTGHCEFPFWEFGVHFLQ